jgi:hypothetical protein
MATAHSSGKRIFPVKILLTEREALDLHRWAESEDRKVADMAHKGLMVAMYGMVSLTAGRCEPFQGDSSGPLVMMGSGEGDHP